MRKQLPDHNTIAKLYKTIFKNSGFLSSSLVILQNKQKQTITDIDVIAAYQNIIILVEVRGSSDNVRQKLTHLNSLPKELFLTYKKEFLLKIKQKNKELHDLIR